MKRPVAILFLAAYGLSATALAWAAEPSEPEQLHAAVQAICPVSGVELGEHGPPVRVVVGDQDQELFLCCKACLKKQINPEHWATIHANTFQAQHRCPVMKNPLPADASWQIVNGRVVFVCCPPCLDKIAKSFYAESLAKKVQE
jgi:hypothetical protein